VSDYQLLIDVQTIQSPQFAERGIPRYTTELCRALLAAGAPIGGLALNPTLPFPTRLHAELAEAPQLCWNTARTFRRLRDEGPVAYHVMSPLEGPRPVQSAFPPYVLGHGVPLVCTLYDLIPEIFDVFPRGSSYERVYQLRREMMKRSDLLLAISESTRRDAIERFEMDPDRVVMVGTGASAFFRRPTPEDRPGQVLAEQLPDITRPFVFTVTGMFGLDNRKNTEVLIDAFSLLPFAVRKAHQLVVTCKVTAEQRSLWKDRAASRGLADDELVLTDFVLDPVLRALYQEAALFVFPSRYEGFGLPALEAARCGCATITSNTSSMPEILSWAAGTFDPDDGQELASLMERSLTDTGFRDQLHEAAAGASRRHTWERVAERVLEAYGRLDRPSRPLRRRTIRVALVGPVSPEPSGTALYNARLAGALAEHCEVDCIGGQADDDERPCRPPFRRFAASAFGRVLSPSSYDAVVYTLGNDRAYHEAHSLAVRYPGIAWLHDIRLSELYLSFASDRLPADRRREFMASVLASHYGERAPNQLIVGERWSSPEAYEQAGILLTSEVVGKSRGVVVGSHLARRMLELDVGPFTRLPPSWVVPLAVPDLIDPLTTDPAASDGEPPLVVALGRVTPDKRPMTVVDAVSMANQITPLRLAFIGPVEPELRDEIDRRARAVGIADRVDVNGFVGPDRYLEWARRAVCAVELDRRRTGSGSAALGDALAAGLPIVTSVSAGRELPEGTVQLVSHDASAADLNGELMTILSSPLLRQAMSFRAQAYATSWTFDHVADALLEIARRDG